MGAIYSQLSLQERRKIEDWWHAALHLAQHTHDLGLGESCLLHRNLLVHPAEKILLPHPPKIRGDYHTTGLDHTPKAV